jgi:hypothetical protein
MYVALQSAKWQGTWIGNLEVIGWAQSSWNTIQFFQKGPRPGKKNQRVGFEKK